MKELLGKIREYHPKADTEMVEKAFDFASRSHQGHKRLSGDPFITHPLAVALILADLEQSPVTIAAALLHDVIEDAGITFAELKKNFGAEVAKLVEGVTKLSQFSFISREERQAENFRKMFVAMGEDFRIIIIKLADRLHNMQTLQYLSLEKQKETSLETREIYAPLAHRMGMWRLKWQLEDLSFSFLEPSEYEYLKEKVSESRADREVFIAEFIERLKGLLLQGKVEAEVSGRAKHFYSIFQKMQNQHLSFDEIYDLTAVRVLVSTVRECYAVLGLVHDAWKPIPGRFRDYIAMQKSNGYQSLHTTVFGPAGRPVEIQIRTREMHRIAEYGVAAHWRYKEGETDKVLDQKMAWLRRMLEWQSELSDAHDFMENLRIDLMVEEVFVFTPKGDVFGLPVNATPVDFAYRVHTEVGHRCVGAKANGRIIALDHPLQNGDVVEIITGKRDNPSRDWVGFVKTPAARIKIKKWFREQEEERKPQPSAAEKEVQTIKPLPLPRPRAKVKSAVRVAGLENVLVKFSKCCFPLPGDEAVGFVTKGRGIAVHRSSCGNVVRANLPSDRRVTIEWTPSSEQVFPAEIFVEAFDRVGVLKDILSQVSETGTNVAAAKVTTRRGSSALIRLVVDVRNVEHLLRVIDAVQKEADVYSAVRK